MNFRKRVFGFGSFALALTLSFSGIAVSQTGPWNFTNTDEDLTVVNGSLTPGANAATWSISATNKNNNRIRFDLGGITTSTLNPILAITWKNKSTNTSLVTAVTNTAGDSEYSFKRKTNIPSEATTFQTIYVDLNEHGRWNASGTGKIHRFYLRLKESNTGANSTVGDIEIDRIEMLPAEPSTSPSVTITSSTSGVTDGSATGDSSIGLVFTLSEDTTGFTESDIAVTGGTIDTGSFSGSGITYTATFSPTAAGATTIDVAAGAFTGATSSASNLVATQFNC